jgi:hypothetical protein
VVGSPPLNAFGSGYQDLPMDFSIDSITIFKAMIRIVETVVTMSLAIHKLPLVRRF